MGTRKSKAKPKKPSLASQADRHALYERSVQDPEGDAATLAKLYRHYKKADAEVLREDFCGTAALSTQWVLGKKSRRAIGVDLDGPTLQWGKEHHLLPAGPDVAARVELYEADVLDGVGPRVDLACALNFSYCCFKQRSLLRRYFEVVRGGLRPDGVFILDVLGGPESMAPCNETQGHDDFVYRWEQSFFDPLTHEMQCHIHFDFPDRSKLSPAFSYDWRLWTLPELADVLEEVGFSAVHRLWERTNEDGDGTGKFYEPQRVENWDRWWTYIVAER